MLGKKVLAVAAGREHALVSTSDGLVFSWGGGSDVAGRQGALGVPGVVKGELEVEQVVFVAAGEVSGTLRRRAAGLPRKGGERVMSVSGVLLGRGV